MVKVQVKWIGKATYDVEVEPAAGLDVFKAQLFALSSVPPDRVKVMLKGRMLKDDAGLVGLADGAQLTMMGTAGSLDAPPPQPTVFLEDVRAGAAVVDNSPPGLANLGNTCYMNSTVQCLKAVPELAKALSTATIPSNNDSKADLARSFGKLLTLLSSHQASVSPFEFWKALRKAFPQFDQMEQMSYMQQDAEECLSQLLSALAQFLRPDAPAAAAPAAAAATANSNSDSAPDAAAAPKFSSLIDQLFEVSLRTTMLPVDAPADATPIVLNESTRKLECNFRQQMSQMSEGIRLSLEEEMERPGPDDTVQHLKKKSVMTRLPPYLLVHFVRFEWKAKEKVKAKLLKRVTFPLLFDAFEFLSEEGQARAREARETMKANEKIENEADRKPVAAADAAYYELFAVLTHQGRMADGGHYIAWVKESNDKWYEYDDDDVSERKDEDIKKLSGGGDWHSAYLCFFRAVSRDKL